MCDEREWIGVDLDGTLAIYVEGMGPTDIGEPLVPMVENVRMWLQEDFRVKIMTARVAPMGAWAPHVAAITEAIEAWCELHIGQRLEVTCIKDWKMLTLWDDRCVPVMFNQGLQRDFYTRATDLGLLARELTRENYELRRQLDMMRAQSELRRPKRHSKAEATDHE